MITEAEAEEERREAVEEIRDEGVPVLVRFDNNWNVTSSRQRLAASWTDVETYAAITAARASKEDAHILSGDQVIILADKGLGSLSGMNELPLGGAPVRTGFVLLIGSPESHPTPGAVNVRELKFLRVLETKFIGGWPVVHRVHARG